MSLRFRKSINLTKGVKLNLNKNSVSLTTGIKGAHFTVNSKGNTTTSVGIPGSGLSYVKRSSQSTNTKNIEPIQIGKNICIDNESILISGEKVTRNELETTVNECEIRAVMYLIFSFTVFPFMGLLCNVILSLFIQLPYFVMPFILCITGLTMATFKFIIASDYKHMIKLYQMYMDNQAEKNKQDSIAPLNETYIPDIETSDSEEINSLNNTISQPESAPVAPLSEDFSDDTSLQETTERDIKRYLERIHNNSPAQATSNSEPTVSQSKQPSESSYMEKIPQKGILLTYEPDQYFADSGRLCIEKKRASIGLIQRFYKVGFNRAARIMDELCDAGVVGPEEGTKPRKINMTMVEFEDYLNRLHEYQLTNPISEIKVITHKNTELYNSTIVGYKEVKKYTPELLENIKENFIAIDVETTGLDEYADCIVEIAAVIFKNMEVSQKFSTLVYSPVPIEPEASEVNNLTDDMLKDAPQRDVAMLQFSEFIRDALTGNVVLVAHNSYFSYKFICEAFKKCGINASLLMDDTLRLSELYLNARTNRFSDVARHLGIKYPRNHRAEKDAVICGKIYTHFINKYIDNEEYNPHL